MPPAAEVPASVPIGYLVAAICGLVAAVGVLFWQLMSAKAEALALAREVIPVATQLMATVQNLQKLVERLENQGRPQ